LFNAGIELDLDLYLTYILGKFLFGSEMSYYRVQHNEDLMPIWIIIALNALVWVVTNLFQDIFLSFALVSSSVASTPWTIITSMFTHALLPNWSHIVFNMLTFYFFGRFVMSLLGTSWMLFIYLVGGIAGNLLFILLAPHGAAVGASGAVYALGGALIVLRPQLRVIMFPIPVPVPLWVAILAGFVLVLIPGIGVAWQAHLGGLVLGLVAGFLLRKRTRVVLF
jgi:membrane associated rhomboid family serine protease